MTNKFFDFIPIPRGQMNMLLDQPLISDLLGQVGYELRDRGRILFTKDLTAQSPKVMTVDIELVVADFSQFSDDDLLPLDADLEAKVLNEVVAMFLPQKPVPQVIDSTADTK